MLTQERLREVLDYDAETGVLVRRQYVWGGHAAGKAIGSSTKKGYLRTKFDQRSYFVHKLVWLYVYGEWPSGELDHINRNKADNRITNLRLATRSQNQSNIGLTKGNSTGVKGVTWNKRAQKFQASVKASGKNHYLGLFERADDAGMAYAAAARRIHGEFAGVAA
jgi:hypothetical protein